MTTSMFCTLLKCSRWPSATALSASSTRTRTCGAAYVSIAAPGSDTDTLQFTGGSGAPGWTLALACLDYRHFKHNDAAIVHNTWTDSTNKREFPKMIWPTNYTKYACATMFTLFFGGRTFAPKCLVDGVNIQDYLQSHFINAIAYLASHVRDLGIVRTSPLLLPLLYFNVL